jgi:acetyl esterase/lipase
MAGTLTPTKVVQAVMWTAAAACAGALAACSSSPATSPAATTPVISPSPSASASSSDVVAADYLPGLAARMRLPSGGEPAPLIVLVPGGGWSSADPAGLVPLADRLTADGATTALITYATTGTGSTFPEAVDDVACAVRWAAEEATAHGRPPSRVVIAGHSAGGHLASLVAFSGQEYGGSCPYPEVGIDGLIGMAGVYDTDQLRPYLSDWMGVDPASSPDSWTRVNPIAWVRDGKRIPDGLRVLLIHGDADTSVPLAQTTELADALRAADVDTTMEVLPGLGHLELFEAPNAGPPIEAWMTR